MGRRIKIEIQEDKIKYITVTSIDKKIQVPLFLSAAAMMEYIRSYDDTRDFRIACCDMIFEIIRIRNKNELLDIDKQDIYNVDNESLLNILKELIKKNNYMQEYFTNNNCDMSFENFYKSYKYQMEKFAESIKSALSPMIESITQMAKILGESISRMPKLSLPEFKITKFDIPRFEPILKLPAKQISENYVQLLTSNYEDMELRTHTITEINNDLIKKANEYSKIQVQNMFDIRNIMLEEQEARKKSEMESKRWNRWSFIVSILALFISVLSFIGINNMQKIIDQLSSLMGE